MTDMNDWNKSVIEQFRANGGKNNPQFGDRLLLLSTTGAKSGQLRVNPLVYSRDGDNYVIIASKGGAPSHPDWYHNLRRNPVATVELGDETFHVRSTEAKGAKHDELYDRHATLYPVFREYQEKTSRVIPVLILERVP